MSELYEYLQREGIDQIENDEEFVREEHEAFLSYCKEKQFQLSTEDMETVRGRGLDDDYYVGKWNYIRNLWNEFGDVPINPETECIEEDWNEFKAGTHREEIWHWFEQSFQISVAEDLM